MARCASGPSPEARQRTFPSAGLHSRSPPVITKRDSSFPPTPVLGNSRGPFRRRKDGPWLSNRRQFHEDARRRRHRHHRRHQVVGPRARRQRRHPRRRRRPERPRRRRTSAPSPAWTTSRSPTSSIPTPAPTDQASASRDPRGAANAPQTVQDIRQALDDNNLDAVSIATPNHWHSLMTIWGCQAGKDVYVEKPCSHNVHEGRIAVETAPQVRPHRAARHAEPQPMHSWANLAEPSIQSGKFGKLLVSRGLCYKPRNSIGVNARRRRRPPNSTSTSGSARRQSSPLHGNLVHYNWHWFWDFGNGDIGNQGVHQMDVARWVIPGATLPTSVVSSAAASATTDQGETPNTQIAVLRLTATTQADLRGPRPARPTPYHGQKVGNTLHFEDGTSSPASKLLSARAATTPKPLPRTAARSDAAPAAATTSRNFIDAVRSRTPRGPERRHSRRALLQRPVPPGEHLVPPRRERRVQRRAPTPSATTTRPPKRWPAWREHLGQGNGLQP